jgi:hypothetical protein
VLTRWRQSVWDELAHLVVCGMIGNERLYPGRLLLNAEQSNLSLEVVYRPELAIDTREA